ncbi:MAG: hypothetical protein HYX63_17465 [Gammaproteobacteria bacterium]|nr:hypothetical protein [Gammaproteobacteria bacterium]
MDIYRNGARRDRGTTTIVSGLSLKTNTKYGWDDNVDWDAKAKQLVIRPHYVLHTDGITHHNYSICLTLEDISSLIDLLGHAGSATDSKLLRDHLREQIPAIVKILACATGVAPIPVADEEPK